MYSFKEIAAPGDLTLYLRLRRDLYLQTRLAPFIGDSGAELDLDLYDIHSRFYGLYCDDELVGGIRLIVDRRCLHSQTIVDLGLAHGSYDESVSDRTAFQALSHADFPFVGYSDETRAFYETWRSDYLFCEAGRFVIRADHRKLKLAEFVIECSTVAGMIHNRNRVGLGVTFGSYPKAYRRYGYDYIGPSRHYLVNGVRLAGVVGRLCLDRPDHSSLPGHLHERFHDMATTFITSGKMTATS